MNIKNFKIVNKRLLSFILAFNCMFFPVKGKSDRTTFYEKSNVSIRRDNNNNIEYKRYNPETKEYHNISIFDDENLDSFQYGSNQRDFKKNFDSLISDPLIWEEMQSYFPEEKFESHEEAMFFYEKYFELIFDSGCGYAAACNFVFHMFEGREKEFQECFGYPMYTVNKKGYVDFNYEIFILKFFNASILKYQGLSEKVWNSMMKDIYKLRLDNFFSTSGYQRKKPKNYFELTKEEQDEWDRLDAINSEKFHEYFQDWVNSSNKYYNFGVSLDASFGYLYIYLREHGIFIDSQIINQAKDYDVDDIIACDDFELSNDNESLYDVDLHYVYVTDVTNGTITVSSWGRKYVFDNSDATMTTKVLLKLNR